MLLRSERARFVRLLADILLDVDWLLKGWEDQERVPAGSPEGGQFGSGSGGGNGSDKEKLKQTISNFADATKEKHGLHSLSLYLAHDQYLKLDTIIVPKGEQRKGVGTRAMQDIVGFADKHNLTMALTTAQTDPRHGTTSSSRLKAFYKRFGFLENKGRWPEISGNMVRPKQSERRKKDWELKREWDESLVNRVPAGSPEGGQFGSGSGGGGNGTGARSAVETRAKQFTADGAAQATRRGSKPLEGSQGTHPDTIATAPVTGKGLRHDTYTRPDIARMETNEKNFKQDMELFRNAEFYPNFRPDELQGGPKEIAATVKDHMKDNIRFFMRDDVQATAGTDKEETKLWYDGTRIMVTERAERYNLPDSSVAGVYAALSPGKDWFQNVYLADRMMDIYSTKQQHTWDGKMGDKAKEIWKPKDQAILASIQGKKLSELENATQKAMWIRTYDEAYSNRAFRVVNSDGSFGDFARNKDGELSKAAWQTVPQMRNAITALESNGDKEVISKAMGVGHKVRSFYNNMLDPHSANRDITIDTHAVGVALGRPVSQKHAAVMHAMGSAPTDAPESWKATTGSVKTGINGLYSVYADAYREVANELGLEPRQLQSITWETKRKLFSGGKNQRAAIDAVWQAYYSDPGMSLQTAQNRILRIVTGKK